jgi:CheY-like chemotaxis protein
MLAVINGYSSLLLAGLAETDPSYESIREILRAGERAAGLTQQLLAFSRRQMVAPRVLDLNEIVEQTERMLRPLIGETIELTLLLARDLGRVRADAGQLQQVLMNLAVNARDAMHTGGRLTIRTENVTVTEAKGPPEHPLAKGDYVELSISDTGMGISAEMLPHLFEPFFTTKEPGKGTGLGLASVHGIVEQAGGHIFVETELGRGSTFRVLLPRVTTPRDPEAVRGLPNLPTGTETILLVEDEPMVRGLAVQILQACGYRVLEAQDAKEALTLFSQHGAEVDLLLTDFAMPGMNGRELAEQLRAQRPGLPVLLMSGYTDDALVHHGVNDSSLAFLNKPFTSASLAGQVRRALDSASG